MFIKTVREPIIEHDGKPYAMITRMVGDLYSFLKEIEAHPNAKAVYIHSIESPEEVDAEITKFDKDCGTGLHGNRPIFVRYRIID